MVLYGIVTIRRYAWYYFIANIKPSKFSKTTSIGENVTLSVNTDLNDPSTLRWIHNNSSVIEDWNGKTNVTIDNVRLADAGIYECFEEGKRHEGQHSIMILIVRGRFIILNCVCHIK